MPSVVVGAFLVRVLPSPDASTGAAHGEAADQTTPFKLWGGPSCSWEPASSFAMSVHTDASTAKPLDAAQWSASVANCKFDRSPPAKPLGVPSSWPVYVHAPSERAPRSHS